MVFMASIPPRVSYTVTYPYVARVDYCNCIRRDLVEQVVFYFMLRIDKGSRCVLRYTYAFLITLMAFLVL